MKNKKFATAIAIDHKGNITIAYSDKTQYIHTLGGDPKEDERLLRELYLSKKLNYLSIVGPTKKDESFIVAVTRSDWFIKADFFASFNYQWKGNDEGQRM